MNKNIIVLSVLAALSAELRAQDMVAANDVVDCGQVEYNVPVTAEFELTNNGNRSMRISEVQTSCGCMVADFPQKDIQAGEKFMVRMTFDSKQMGHFDKYADVCVEGSDEPLMLRMKGVVVREVKDYSGDYPYKIGTLLADRNTLEFNDVNNGETPQLKIHIRNTGGETAEPVVMHLPDYLEADVSPSKIKSGRAGVVTITLDSRKLDDLGLTETKVFLGNKPGDKVDSDKEISVSAVLLPQFQDMTEAELALAPAIEVSEKELNLGAADGKKKLKGTVMIKNTGKSELRISNLQMFSSALSVSLNKSVLDPGEEAKLKVTANVERMKKSKSEPKVLMITNDPNNPKVEINVVVSGI
ncbi:DUF1573 domain-containing protein [Prevotella sp. HCN-7019]|uniref:DUF1573 domain-containing protein n=1 Tax=Prevotella sp. HCN-7019 TaxID=3134668 RepID=UPI0030BFA3C7